MKKLVAMIGLVIGLAGLSHAGTPMENLYMGQAPLSGTTILGSTASAVSNTNIQVTVSSPTTTLGQSGTTVSGRNCFTKFFVQVPTTTVIVINDGPTTKWTIYGAGLGTTGSNSLSLPEDHLGPWCAAVGDSVTFALTNTSGSGLNPQVINYEGYTQFGGTSNAGPMQ